MTKNIKKIPKKEIKEIFKRNSKKNSIIKAVNIPNVDVIVYCKDGYKDVIKNIISYDYDSTVIKQYQNLEINITTGLVFENIDGNIVFIKNDNIGSFKVVSKFDNTKNKLVPNGSLEKVDYGGVDSGA